MESDAVAAPYRGAATAKERSPRFAARRRASPPALPRQAAPLLLCLVMVLLRLHTEDCVCPMQGKLHAGRRRALVQRPVSGARFSGAHCSMSLSWHAAASGGAGAPPTQCGPAMLSLLAAPNLAPPWRDSAALESGIRKVIASVTESLPEVRVQAKRCACSCFASGHRHAARSSRAGLRAPTAAASRPGELDSPDELCTEGVPRLVALRHRGLRLAPCAPRMLGQGWASPSHELSRRRAGPP